MVSYDADKEFMVAKANLMVRGLIIEEGDGITFTQKGKDEALVKWTELTNEDKLLFGWMIKNAFIELENQ